MKKFIALLLSMITVPIVSAHTAMGGGIVNGILHPVFGLDHLLAMVAVGILSVQIGGKAIWQVPAAFVGVMLVGGILGILGISVLAVEIGIAISVFFLGVGLAFDKKLPVLFSMVFVGFFAIFHGIAHGMEMPNLAEPVLYAIGFIISTAGLHITGVFIGVMAKRMKKGRIFLRFVGAGIAGIGLAFLLL